MSDAMKDFEKWMLTLPSVDASDLRNHEGHYQTMVTAKMYQAWVQQQKRIDSLLYGVECMQKVLLYVGDCAGVSHGNVAGLIDWADQNRIKS
jgi:hypothetical protein